MSYAKIFIDELVKHGIKSFSGVPCSFMNPLFYEISARPDTRYLTASSEGEALAIASGGWLGGKKYAIMCQNSGLGNMVNPLTSLNATFLIPVLLLISHRGFKGVVDEPQHQLMGSITTDLLDLLKIEWTYLPENFEDISRCLEHATKKMQETNLPYAILVKKDSFSQKNTDSKKSVEYNANCLQTQSTLTRFSVLKAILDHVPDNNPIIATTGKTGRELYALKDSKNHFYCVGSMGYANSIATGLALSLKQEIRVFVLDGDGAALMHLGNLATIGASKVKNLVHIIFDNGSYNSTGGQSTASATTNFVNVAKSTGYEDAVSFSRLEEFTNYINNLKEKNGPILIHVKIKPCSIKDLGRPTVKPFEVARRLLDFVKELNS